MISLFLTVLCSTSIALILKYNETRGGHPLLLLVGNYLVAAIVGFIFILTSANPSFSIETFVFGVLLASLFVGSFFAFARAVGAAGTALATVSSRLSVIVSLLLSIIIYGEDPNNLQLAGIFLALLTIYLFYKSLRRDSKNSLMLLDYFYLLAVLLGIGINDFALKVFQHWRPVTEKPFFIFTIFLFSFLFSAMIFLLRKIKWDKEVFLAGGILGIPNVFSTFFLLLALAALPAIIVYPLVNIGIILLTTIGASIIWKEKLNTFGRWALVCGVMAIFLLGTN